MSLVHLQCNVGQDTLSRVQLGAIVTGIDISDEAIALQVIYKECVKHPIVAVYHQGDIPNLPLIYGIIAQK